MSSDGFIINSCLKENVSCKWSKAVDDLVILYQRLHGDNLSSVYLRGSLPRGTMVESISDIDSFCLTKSRTDKGSQALEEEYRSVLENKYSFVNSFEIESYSSVRALKSRDMRFLLKTQCLCMWGVDVSTEIEPMVISQDAMNTCLYLPKINDDFLKAAEAVCTIKDASELCSWIFKITLRAAFEIVMLREGKFTRDIYFCWLSYSHYYTEYSDDMKHALNLIINPISDIQQIRSFWERMLNVLLKNVHNDEHLLAG